MTNTDFIDGLPDMRDEEISRKVAHNLRTIRKTRGYTLELLSDQTGLSVSYISRLEAGTRRMNLDILTSVSRALQCEISDILYGNTSHIVSFQDLGRQYISSMTGKDNVYAPLPAPFGPRKLKQKIEALEALTANSAKAFKDLPLYGTKVTIPGQKGVEGVFDFDKSRESTYRTAELAGIKDAFAIQIPDNSFMPRYSAGDVLHIHPSKTPLYKSPVIAILNNNHVVSGLFQDWVDGGVSIFLFKGTELVTQKILSTEMKSIYRVVAVTYAQ
jgi:transcriptional regulator with XRE-family HTH domain